jgi:hypothetical protein
LLQQVHYLAKADYVDTHLVRELPLPTAWCFQNRGHHPKSLRRQILLGKNLRRYTDADLIEPSREMRRNSVRAQYRRLFEPSCPPSIHNYDPGSYENE